MKPLWNRFHFKHSADATRKTAVLSISLMRVRQVSVSVRQWTSDWKQGSFSAIWIHFLSLCKAWQEGGVLNYSPHRQTALRSIIINQDFYESKPRGHMPSLLGSASGEEEISNVYLKPSWSRLFDWFRLQQTKFAWKLQLSLAHLKEKCVNFIFRLSQG